MPMVCEDGRPYLTDPVTGRRLCACHLAPEGAHSHLHAPGALTGSLKSLAAPLPGSAPGGAPAMETGAAFYTPLLRGFAAVRPERLAQCLTPSAPPLAFDPALSVHPYGLIGYAGLDMNGLGMRKAATRETTGPLKAWLHEHRKNPYPTKAEKIMLAIITKMTLTQVSTWFANARRRLKKESRLYTGPDNDNDDNDDDLHHKDDDQALDSDCTRSQHRERCDSDEDINVDVSDVSDSEDVVTTTTAATPSLASPTHPAPTPTTPTTKHSPPTSSLSSSFTSSSSSSSSGLSPFPPTPPFHPSFLARPGPVPDLALCRVGVGAVPQSPSLPAQLVVPAALKSPSALSNGLTASHAPPLPPSSLLDTAALKTSSLSSSSNGSAVVSPLPSRSSSSGKTGCSPAVLSKPKIWSISEIIHSDRSSPPPPSSGTCSGRLDDAPRGSSSVKVLSPRDVPSTAMGPHRAELFSPAHRPDFLSHRLTSPFRTLETPEVRLASRQASAFLVPGPHSAWGVSPVGALRLASACHVMNAGGGKEGGREGSPVDRRGSPGSEGSTEKGSPQTEALDLHTKKEDLDSTLATT